MDFSQKIPRADEAGVIYGIDAIQEHLFGTVACISSGTGIFP